MDNPRNGSLKIVRGGVLEAIAGFLVAIIGGYGTYVVAAGEGTTFNRVAGAVTFGLISAIMLVLAFGALFGRNGQGRKP